MPQAPLLQPTSQLPSQLPSQMPAPQLLVQPAASAQGQLWSTLPSAIARQEQASTDQRSRVAALWRATEQGNSAIAQQEQALADRTPKPAAPWRSAEQGNGPISPSQMSGLGFGCPGSPAESGPSGPPARSGAVASQQLPLQQAFQVTVASPRERCAAPHRGTIGLGDVGAQASREGPGHSRDVVVARNVGLNPAAHGLAGGATGFRGLAQEPKRTQEEFLPSKLPNQAIAYAEEQARWLTLGAQQQAQQLLLQQQPERYSQQHHQQGTQPSVSDDFPARGSSKEVLSPSSEEDHRARRGLAQISPNSAATRTASPVMAWGGSERPSLSSPTFFPGRVAGPAEQHFPAPQQPAWQRQQSAEGGTDPACEGHGRPMLPSEDVEYLKKNIEHLRSVKHRLEARVQDLEARVRGLEQRKQQYKMLYEQAQQDAQCRGSGGSGELEISSLHQQLSALELLKDALNAENADLQGRLEATQQTQGKQSRQSTCVVCLDNLANVVCIPCKHLALCTYCAARKDMVDCPICRTSIGEKMQIYTP